MATLFVTGRLFDVVLIVFFTIVTWYMMWVVKRWSPPIREIPAVAAVRESVGRAVEMGRPVHFTTGYGGDLSKTEDGPQIMAGLGVFAYVAQLCAKFGAKLIVSVGQPDTYPLLEQYLKAAYLAEGKPVPNIPDTLRFISREQFAWVSGVTGIMRREKPAANIAVGPFWAESAQLVMSGFEVGAMQVIGTARPAQIAWFAVFSDYVLIGEEMYVAGAQLSGDKETINTLAAQDVGKFLAVGMIVLGLIMTLAGIPWLLNVVRM